MGGAYRQASGDRVILVTWAGSAQNAVMAPSCGYISCKLKSQVKCQSGSMHVIDIGPD